MKIQVRKWGNSLAIRIPKSFAKETQIDQGTFIDLSLDDGRLIATPIDEEEYFLEQLLFEITEENIHSELDTGKPVGKEIW